MTDLEKRVVEIVENRGDRSDQLTFAKDILQHGCISGTVGELIY